LILGTMDILIEALRERMKIYDPCFLAPSVEFLQRGDPKLLVEFADVVVLALVKDHELSDFLKRDVARLTPLVWKPPSAADTQVGFERFRKGIQSRIFPSEQER